MAHVAEGYNTNSSNNNNNNKIKVSRYIIFTKNYLPASDGRYLIAFL